MRHSFDFVRATVKGALVVLTPMLLIVLLGEKILSAIREALLRLSGWLPEGIPFRGVLTLLALLVLCFLIGLFLQSRPGRRITEWLEAHVFERIPGYALVRSFFRRIVGLDDARGFETVLAEMEGGFVVAFQVEEYDDGFVALFMPGSPTPTSGSIFLYPRSLVHPVNVSFFHTVRCVARWGVGSGKLLTALGSTPEGAAVLRRVRDKE